MKLEGEVLMKIIQTLTQKQKHLQRYVIYGERKSATLKTNSPT